MSSVGTAALLQPTPARLPWPDAVRILATVTIFVFHFTDSYVGSAGAQSSDLHLFIDLHFNVWGIAAFVVLSGFALALSLLSTRSLHYRRYLSKRLTRLFPPYWTVALPAIVMGFALAEAPLGALWKVPIWLLGLGPISPSTYLPIAESWWYVSLALQISLVMPVVARVYRRVGPIRATVIALAVNAATLAMIDLAGERWSYLTQGLVFARLAEVMAGVIAAGLVLARRTPGRNLKPGVISVLLVVACAPLLARLGARTDAPALVALALIFLACALFLSKPKRERPWLAMAASYTYVYYLSHAPVTKYAVITLDRLGVVSLVIVLPLVLSVTVLVAVAFEWFARRYATGWFERALRYLSRGAVAPADEHRPA